jgi:hypothetical protein
MDIGALFGENNTLIPLRELPEAVRVAIEGFESRKLETRNLYGK